MKATGPEPNLMLLPHEQSIYKDLIVGAECGPDTNQ
jgi:hypothetical protein